MEKSTIIKNAIAVLLLLLFIISITPKTYFHDSIADHTDASSCSHTHREYGLHKEKIDCHFDNLVVTAPFVYHLVPCFTALVFYRFLYHNNLYSSFSQSCFLSKAGRSPPAA